MARKVKVVGRSNESSFGTGKFYGDEVFKALGIVPGPLPTLSKSAQKDGVVGLICSFCGNPVEESRATQGYSRLRGRVDTAVRFSGNKVSLENLYVINNRVTACPDCCLKVERTKFPYDEG